MTPRRIALVVVAGCLLLMAYTVEAAELSGSWKGSLTGSDGSSGEVQVDFSPQGFPLYSYTNNKGVCGRSNCLTLGRRWNMCRREAACNGWW